MSSLESPTVTDYIDKIRDEPIRVETLHLHEAILNEETLFVVNDLSILRNYWAELVETSKLYTLKVAEQRKYFYRPWLYCHDTYGNKELWFELLKLNQMASFTEFDHETIRIFDNSILRKIKMILSAEKDVIDLNEEIVLNAKKEAAI